MERRLDSQPRVGAGRLAQPVDERLESDAPSISTLGVSLFSDPTMSMLTTAAMRERSAGCSFAT